MSQGYIQSIKPKETSAGTMYDFQIDGRTIGAGKFPPKGFEAGDYVNYEVIEKGKYLNLKAGSMSKATPPAGTAPKPAATSSSDQALANHDAKEEAHSRGAATNTALAWVKLLSEADALPMPAKVAKDKKADVMYEVLKEYVGKFYTLTTGRAFVDNEPATSHRDDLAAAEVADDNWVE